MIFTICGWESLPASEASVSSNLRYALARLMSRKLLRLNTLSATCCWLNGSSARYTVLVAPCPNSLTISYLPIFSMRESFASPAPSPQSSPASGRGGERERPPFFRAHSEGWTPPCPAQEFKGFDHTSR